MTGIELLFYSADHDPAHFHVRKPGEWEIRVNILATTSDQLAYTFKWPRTGATVPSGLQKQLRRATVQHREALLTEWQAKVLVMEGI
jgi:hypothetical protein